MGFRSKAFCKVWEIAKISDTNTKIRISISRKNKQTGDYEQDFSGYVNCVGEAAAKKALLLKEEDSIQLGDVDVKTKYDGVRKVTYTNFFIYSFESDGNSPAPTRRDSRDVSEGFNEDERPLPF